MSIFSVRDYPEQAAKNALDYELVDFGTGRKLERFGGVLVDRPAVGVESPAPHRLSPWKTTTVRFVDDPAHGTGWMPEEFPPWTVRWRGGMFELRTTAAGQVGIFPEQSSNWGWIDAAVRRFAAGIRVLNLFAYTGASTLVAARAGAEVVHVDAQKSVVAWAKRNADISGLASAPIRWIVDDARKFVRREIRRGRTYDGIILDPPSYGHGSHGEPWKFEQDLHSLLHDCCSLWCPENGFFLLSCHTPGWDPQRLRAAMRPALDHCPAVDRTAEACGMMISTPDGRAIECGSAVRWPPAWEFTSR